MMIPEEATPEANLEAEVHLGVERTIMTTTKMMKEEPDSMSILEAEDTLEALNGIQEITTGKDKTHGTAILITMIMIGTITNQDQLTGRLTLGPKETNSLEETSSNLNQEDMASNNPADLMEINPA